MMPPPLWLFEPHHDNTNKMTLRPAKTQISLGIRPVWSESSLCAQWVAKDPRFLLEKTDQTGQMPKLIRVFAGRRVILLFLSWGGSFCYRICLSHNTGKMACNDLYLDIFCINTYTIFNRKPAINSLIHNKLSTDKISTWIKYHNS